MEPPNYWTERSHLLRDGSNEYWKSDSSSSSQMAEWRSYYSHGSVMYESSYFNHSPASTVLTSNKSDLPEYYTSAVLENNRSSEKALVPPQTLLPSTVPSDPRIRNRTATGLSIPDTAVNKLHHIRSEINVLPPQAKNYSYNSKTDSAYDQQFTLSKNHTRNNFVLQRRKNHYKHDSSYSVSRQRTQVYNNNNRIDRDDNHWSYFKKNSYYNKKSHRPYRTDFPHSSRSEKVKRHTLLPKPSDSVGNSDRNKNESVPKSAPAVEKSITNLISKLFSEEANKSFQETSKSEDDCVNRSPVHHTTVNGKTKEIINKRTCQEDEKLKNIDVSQKLKKLHGSKTSNEFLKNIDVKKQVNKDPNQNIEKILKKNISTNSLACENKVVKHRDLNVSHDLRKYNENKNAKLKKETKLLQNSPKCINSSVDNFDVKSDEKNSFQSSDTSIDGAVKKECSSEINVNSLGKSNIDSRQFQKSVIKKEQITPLKNSKVFQAKKHGELNGNKSLNKDCITLKSSIKSSARSLFEHMKTRIQSKVSNSEESISNNDNKLKNLKKSVVSAGIVECVKDSNVNGNQSIGKEAAVAKSVSPVILHPLQMSKDLENCSQEHLNVKKNCESARKNANMKSTCKKKMSSSLKKNVSKDSYLVVKDSVSEVGPKLKHHFNSVPQVKTKSSAVPVAADRKQTAKKSFTHNISNNKQSSVSLSRAKVLVMHANKIKNKNKKKYFRGGRYKLYVNGYPKKKKKKKISVNENSELMKNESNLVTKENCEKDIIADDKSNRQCVPLSDSQSNFSGKCCISPNLKMPLNEILWSKLNAANCKPITNAQKSRKTFTVSVSGSSCQLSKNELDVGLFKNNENMYNSVGVAKKSVQSDRKLDNSKKSEQSGAELSKENNTEQPELSEQNTDRNFCNKEISEVITASVIENFAQNKKKCKKEAAFETVFNKRSSSVVNRNTTQTKAPVLLKNGISQTTCTCLASPLRCVPLTNGILRCQAVDSIDEEEVNCSYNMQKSYFVRPSLNMQYKVMCELHFWRLRRHHCCPVCGLFCTQGVFLQCTTKNTKHANSQFHLFHQKCLTDPKSGCPHCTNVSSFENVQLLLRSTKNQEKALDAIRDTDSKSLPGEINITNNFNDYCIMRRKLSDEEYSQILIRQYLYIPKEDSLKAMHKLLSNEKAVSLRPSGKCLSGPVKSGDVEKVLQVLANGVDPNYKFENSNNYTSLHIAAASGFVDIVHILVQAGACMNLINEKLSTPLMLAVETFHHPVVQYLVMAGADLSAQDEEGMTCFHIAARGGDQSICKLLYKTGKISINLQDDGGWTALVWACEHKHFEIVKWLLHKGADPNVRDNEYNVALHWAVLSGSANIVKVLIERGCNINAVNKHGDSALHIAAREDFHECISLLCSKGAVIDKTNIEGLTPIMCCRNTLSKTWKTLNMYNETKISKKVIGVKSDSRVYRDVSYGKEFHPIEIINDVDGEEFIANFHYIMNHCESSKIVINKIVNSMRSCICEGSCSVSSCTCSILSLMCWYDKNGRLGPEFNIVNPPAIFECNRMCHCPATCVNRVVQNGIKCHLQVFRTVGKGWGVRTAEVIPRGTFICEYLGELIASSEIEGISDSYLFELDNKEDELYYVDASCYGNVSRFLNHSCDPNIIAVKVFINHHDLNFPHIAFFSTREIKQYEELCFDYGDSFWIAKCKSLLCACSSSLCRYSKDTIDETLLQYNRHVTKIHNVVVHKES